MRAYHDHEWGTPIWDDDRLQFEFLVLEGAQAGLSWRTVLHKRKEYRRAYHNFDVSRVACYGQAELKALLSNSRIIRNRLKVAASIDNARAFILVQKEFGSFCSYLWHFVNGRPISRGWCNEHDLPAETELSRRVSRDLKARGFRFVGPIIVYAHLQAAGVVNDHVTKCFRYTELTEASNQP